MFLIDKPKTDADKLYNKNTLQLANGIKNEKELAYQTGRYGFQNNTEMQRY